MYTCCSRLLVLVEPNIRKHRPIVMAYHHHHHQFNTHECSMKNKIHEKAHTIIQKGSTKKIQKDE